MSSINGMISELSSRGCYEELQKLLKTNASNWKSARSSTAIKQAVIGAHSNENIEGNQSHDSFVKCVKLLASNQFDVNAVDAADKRTALHWAVQLYDDVMTSLLMDVGANCALLDAIGHSPLTLAVKLNILSCLRNIVKRANKKVLKICIT